METNTKRILYLDSSAFKESGCMRRLEHIIVDGMREAETSAALSYGTAVHKFVGELRTTGNLPAAIQCALSFYLPISSNLHDKEWRNLDHLLKTCGGYHKEVYLRDTLSAIKVPIEIDGKKEERVLIEQKFSIKVYEDDELIIMLCGTIDEIGMLENRVVICDRKTSSANPQKTQESLSLYQHSTQMMFYKFIAEKALGFKNLPAIIDGIFLSSNLATKFVKSPVYEYDSADMTRFEEQLDDTLKEVVKAYRNKAWKKNFLHCDSSRYDNDKIGSCKFFKFCSESDKDIREFMRVKHYVVKEYNPLKFDEQRT